MTQSDTIRMPAEALDRIRDRLLDLSLPLSRIVDCVERTVALARDLEGQSRAATEHLLELTRLLGMTDLDDGGDR